MLEQKIKNRRFGDDSEVNKKIEQTETMLTWVEDPKVMKKGIKKAVSLLSLYPVRTLREVGVELGEALSFLDDVHYKSRTEAVLANVSRKYSDRIDSKALQKMSASDNWYVRWLSIWIMNNMAFENTEHVPSNQLDVLVSDEDERVKEFARRVTNRIEKFKVSEI